MNGATTCPRSFEEEPHRGSIVSNAETLAIRPKLVERLPYAIAYFLGYRRALPPPETAVVRALWSFAGVFCSIAVIETVSCQIPLFREHGGPIIVGSFGAAAVLEFHVINSPLAQPRNFLLSQLLASIVGTAFGKLFQMDPAFESIRWIAGALSCSIVTAIMGLTGTVHPPAGATALIAVVDDSSLKLGWFLIPLVLLGCTIMLLVALIFNNIQRRFPMYWWSPGDLDPSVTGTRPHVNGGSLQTEDSLRVVEEGRGGMISKHPG